MTRETDRSPSASGKVLYHDDFSANKGVWRTGKAAADGSWHRNIFGERGEALPLTWSGADGGYIWTQPPWYFDDNHGELFWLYLLFFVNRSEDAGLAGVDLRNVVIDLSLRGRDWDFHGTELCFWIQGKAEAGYGVNNWCLTSQSIRALSADDWGTHRVQLVNDERAWRAMGHINGGLARKLVVRQSPSAMEGTLDATLARDHLNFGFILGMVDPNDPPTGRIEIGEVTIARNDK